MMGNTKSLLLDLAERDFATVQADVELDAEGAMYYYAIDFYDLAEFCFPFGLREESEANRSEAEKLKMESGGKADADRKQAGKDDKDNNREKSLEYVGDVRYTFYQIFMSPSKSRVLLMDEYIDEVLHLKRYLKYTIENGVRLVDTLREYERRADLHPGLLALHEQQTNEITETVDTKLSILLSLALDVLNDGIANLMNLFREKHITLRHEDLVAMNHNDEIEKEHLIEAFDSFKGEDSHEDLILRSFFKSESKKRDARAISRIISINNHLEEQYLKGVLKRRCIILYLSSTESSRILFKDPSFSGVLPRIKDKPYVFLRTIPQVFLKHLCTTSSSPREIKDNIEYLRKTILEIIQYKHRLLAPHKMVQKILIDKFDRYREHFENDAIMNRYETFAKTLEDTQKKLAAGGITKRAITDILKPWLKDVIDKGQKANKTAIKNLVSLETWSMQAVTLVYTDKIIYNFSKRTSRVSIKTGDDSIRSIVHHLPIVYFSNSNIVREIMRLTTQVIIDKKRGVLHEELNQQVIALLRSSHEIGRTLEGRLMQAFLLLIMPDDDLPEGDFVEKNTNYLAYSWANDILQREILGRQPGPASSSSDGIATIEADYRYFVSWAARRAKYYPQSMEMLRGSARKFGEDPRFPHGLSLTQYCIQSTIKDDSAKQVELLDKSIAYCKNALDLYEVFQDDNYILRKTRLALLNSMAFLNLELHLAENKPNENKYLLVSEEFITRLKANEPDYYYFPEYLHTESLLKYCQAVHLRHNAAETFEIKSALKSSSELIDNAINLINENQAAPNSLSLPKYNDHKKKVAAEFKLHT